MNDTKNIPFQWQVVICDDNPSDPGVENTEDLLRKGDLLAVRTIANTTEFISKYAQLCKADIVLMDMKWINFGKEFGVGTSPYLLPEDHTCEGADFVKKWIKAIDYWVKAEAVSPTTDGWPRARMSESEIGVWLAAMVSHIAPKAHLVLFSSVSDLVNKGIAAALGRFHDAVYDVQPKPSDGLSIAELSRQLSKRQRTELQNPVIYKWYLSKVLFPLLLQRNPVQERLTLPSIYGTDTQVCFTAAAFFPNLRWGEPQEQSATRSNLATLKDFLEPVRMSDEQQSFLSTCVHEIGRRGDGGRCKREVWHKIPVEKVTGVLETACAYANQAGDFGFAAASHIRQALKAAALNSIQDAIKLADEAEQVIADQEARRPLRRIKQLCTEYNGSFSGDDRTINETVMMNFNIGGFEKAVKVLVHNADKYDHGQKICLTCKVNEDTLVITCLSHWKGIEINDFKNSILDDSLERGAHRGLPYTLLFGLLYGACSTEFLIAEQWHPLHPDPFGAPTPKMSEERSFNYGIRWIFPIIPSAKATK